MGWTMKIIGIATLFDSHMNFGLPIFIANEEQNLPHIQNISKDGRVSGFISVDVEALQICPMSERLERQPGELAIYAFEHEPEVFWVGEKSTLIPAIEKMMRTTAVVNTPFSHSVMAAFCGNDEARMEADISSVGKFAPGRSRAHY